MTEQKLTAKVEAQGADQAAKEIGKVAGATEELKERTGEHTERITKNAEAQQKLNASESDYVSLLSQIDPRLGRFADALFKSQKISGDFASSQVELGDVTEATTSAFAAQANTLKVLGIAGGVTLMFVGLAKAIEFVQNRSEKLRQEIERLKAQKTTEEEERLVQQREITRIARGRKEKGFTAAEEAEAERVFQEITERGVIGEDLMGALQENIAALVGRFTAEQIEQLTLGGFRAEVGAPAAIRARRAERALERPETAELAARERERVEAERIRRARGAFEEATGDATGSMAELKELVEKFGAGLDSDAIIELVQAAVQLRKNLQERAKKLREETGKPLEFLDLTIAQLVGRAAREKTAFGGLLGVHETPAERRVAEDVIRAMDRLTNTLEHSPANVTINQQNSRFIGPDAASKAARTINGQNLMARRELG